MRSCAVFSTNNHDNNSSRQYAAFEHVFRCFVQESIFGVISPKILCRALLCWNVTDD